MISYSGIFRAAKLVIDQHCEGAATFATGRAGCSRTATPSALAHFLSGRHDKPCSWAERAMRAAPSRVTPVRTLAASYAMAGWMEEAHHSHRPASPDRPQIWNCRRSVSLAISSMAGSRKITWNACARRACQNDRCVFRHWGIRVSLLLAQLGPPHHVRLCAAVRRIADKRARSKRPYLSGFCTAASSTPASLLVPLCCPDQDRL